MKRLVVLGGVVAIASVAGAQSFNIDLDTAPGTLGAGLPASSFAAAALAGTWNGITVNVASSPLLDITGGATGVTVNVTALGTFNSNNQAYTGDAELLMADIADGPSAIAFSGLADGVYDVYVYAQAPDDPTFLTDVTIGGNTQTVGGAWGGTFVAGNTHSLHTNVNVVGGSLSVTMAVNTGFASMNGIQLVAVPEPATIAAFAVGGLTLLALRRRKN